MPHSASTLRRRLDRAAERINPPSDTMAARREAFEMERAYLDAHIDVDRQLSGLANAWLRTIAGGDDDPDPERADELQGRFMACHEQMQRDAKAWHEGNASL